MNSYGTEQESDDPIQCDNQNVCCRVSFADDAPGKEGKPYYPPTPAPKPEPYYPTFSRDRTPDRDLEVCGIQRAYGIHSRLEQLQYPADVSEFGEYPWQVSSIEMQSFSKSVLKRMRDSIILVNGPSF